MDTRFKRERRQRVVDTFVSNLKILYQVDVSFEEDIWSSEDDTNPTPGFNVIQVRVKLLEEPK